MAKELTKGDLVEVTVVGLIEEASDLGYIVRIHGELVPVLKSQVHYMEHGDAEPAKEVRDAL